MSSASPDADAPVRPKIVLGVGGGIAAYKACEVLRRLTESGHSVRVIPTEGALKFVGAATFEALSGQVVTADPFDDVHEVPHVRLGQNADLVVVAPATANLIAKAAHGLADDLLTNTLLTARCPVLLVPAMHTEMWEHPATQHNVALLRSRGVIVAEPASGRLTGKDTGKGACRTPPRSSSSPGCSWCAVTLCSGATGRRARRDLRRRYARTARPGALPREPLVGQAGLWRLARVAAQRGARVTLVAGNTADLSTPAGVDLVRVGSAMELRDAMHKVSADADVVVMAAAVADFRPVSLTGHKIKKTSADPDPISLTKNPDILVELVSARREGQLIVGFAAETGDDTTSVLDYGRACPPRGSDLLVVNAVGDGKAFEQEDNAGWLLSADGAETPIPHGPKTQLASVVWDAVTARSTDSQ